MDDATAPKIEYGVTPTEVMAAMAGIDFVRAVFDGKLPAPPIMHSIEPFDSTAQPGVVVMYRTPRFRHYNPTGSVQAGSAAPFLASARRAAISPALAAGARS